MKPNNIEEVATKVYNYMQEHKIIGKENGYNRLTLAFLLGIGERRFREALSYINEHDEKFDRAVSTSHCIYLCETDEEEGWAYGATWTGAWAVSEHSSPPIMPISATPEALCEHPLNKCMIAVSLESSSVKPVRSLQGKNSLLLNLLQ